MTIEEIRRKIEKGAFQEARQIVQQELEMRPDNEELQEIWDVIKPSEVREVDTDPALRKRVAADYQWLKTQSDPYRGQWVALDAGELVDNADTFQELWNKVGNFDDYLITVVAEGDRNHVD